MKKVKSSNKKDKKLFSDLFDPDEVENSAKKRKTPNKKKKSEKPLKKSIKEQDFIESEEETPKKRKTMGKRKKTDIQIQKPTEEAEDENNNEKIFQGIGEKDPSFSEIKVEELEYPYWLRPENLKDSLGRPYDNESEYDASTIQIPEKEFKKLSPIFKQYWEIKSKNFDKIVFFKMGLPFFCFYDDALIMGKVADLKVQFWGTRPYALIFPKSRPSLTEKLVALGYKVATVDQTETELTKKDNLCKREITEIVSTGTTTDESFWKNHSDPKFLLCLLQQNGKFGLTFVDCLTQSFFFEEVSQIEDLKTIIYRMKPVEVVSKRGFLDMEIMQFIKNASHPVFNQFCFVLPTLEEVFIQWEEFFKEEKMNMPTILSQIKNEFMKSREKNPTESEERIPNYYLIQSLYMSFSYLKSNLIANTFLYGNFAFFNMDFIKSQRLYMDSVALRSLEIFDVNCESKILNQKSLFNYIDKTTTGYGKRLLKRWLGSPLRNKKEINDRLDALEDFNKNCNIADYFHSKIVKLPDFERVLGRIHNSTNKQKLACSSFTSFASSRLNEFFKLLDDFSKVQEIIEGFEDYKGKFKSDRLKKLVTIKTTLNDEKGLFPNITLLSKEINEMVVWENEVVVPKSGINQRYDEIAKKIKKIQDQLDEFLIQLRKKLKSNDINYNHNKIRRYEIEIPDKLCNNLPSDLVLTSKKKGFMRYQNQLIENFQQELENYEADLNDTLGPFFLEVFNKFFEKHQNWQQVVSCLAEIDCLVGLSKLLSEMKPFLCRPSFTEDKHLFKLEQVFHPCLIEYVPNFVPNDICFSKDVQALLITGPNMGGKSTILRQACIAIILAQLGSYVPAKTFVLSPFDRIFCRIGANDKILEGKSTFFMEMEETSTILKEATQESFVIFDELGRGTSTYDGVALAYGVLKYVVENIHCKTMFSTHYHLLIEEFKLFQTIKNYYMDFKYNEKEEEIEFYYKFIEGEACRSFGINVAKIVGVPTKVLEIAKEKAQSLNKELQNLRGFKSVVEKFNECLSLI